MENLLKFIAANLPIPLKKKAKSNMIKWLIILKVWDLKKSKTNV